MNAFFTKINTFKLNSIKYAKYTQLQIWAPEICVRSGYIFDHRCWMSHFLNFQEYQTEIKLGAPALTVSSSFKGRESESVQSMRA